MVLKDMVISECKCNFIKIHYGLHLSRAFNQGHLFLHSVTFLCFSKCGRQEKESNICAVGRSGMSNSMGSWYLLFHDVRLVLHSTRCKILSIFSSFFRLCN